MYSEIDNGNKLVRINRLDGVFCDKGLDILRQLIDNAFNDRAPNNYNLKRPMRMRIS